MIFLIIFILIVVGLFALGAYQSNSSYQDKENKNAALGCIIPIFVFIIILSLIDNILR